jgi:hypothetical protein
MDPEKELLEYFSKTISTKIIKQVKNFSEEYAKINDAQFLIDNIYQTKLSELNSIFKINTDIIKTVKSRKI